MVRKVEEVLNIVVPADPVKPVPVVRNVVLSSSSVVTVVKKVVPVPSDSVGPVVPGIMCFQSTYAYFILVAIHLFQFFPMDNLM